LNWRDPNIRNLDPRSALPTKIGDFAVSSASAHF
jgi:hypothetical protein